MYQPLGMQKTIKMTSHNQSKITSGKVILKRTKDNWEISLKAFWTEPVDAQMFIVGKTARKVLDIVASEGAFSANKKLSYLMWNDFIIAAKMIVIISKNIPILKAVIPPVIDMDVHKAMTIIRCGSVKKITARTQKETVKKEVEQKFLEEQSNCEKNKQQIKSILSIKPCDRKRNLPPKKPMHMRKACENSLIPMSWSTLEIDKCLVSQSIASPFLGHIENAAFAKIKITDSLGFSHIVLGRVLSNDMYVYMICIPGAAFMPPKGLAEYNRWLPAIAGSGYWVKYFTKPIS